MEIRVLPGLMRVGRRLEIAQSLDSLCWWDVADKSALGPNLRSNTTSSPNGVVVTRQSTAHTWLVSHYGASTPVGTNLLSKSMRSTLSSAYLSFKTHSSPKISLTLVDSFSLCPLGSIVSFATRICVATDVNNLELDAIANSVYPGLVPTPDTADRRCGTITHLLGDCTTSDIRLA